RGALALQKPPRFCQRHNRTLEFRLQPVFISSGRELGANRQPIQSIASTPPPVRRAPQTAISRPTLSRLNPWLTSSLEAAKSQSSILKSRLFLQKLNLFSPPKPI